MTLLTYKFANDCIIITQVFRQGFVEACFRSVCTWVRRDGVPVHSSDTVEELVKQGVGKCANTAIHLFVGAYSYDRPMSTKLMLINS